MRRVLLLLVLASVVAGACGSDLRGDPAWNGPAAARSVTAGGSAIRLLFAGDVMLGRQLTPVVAADPGSVFADVRYVVSGADLAVANLESPLTDRAHEAENPNSLEAPASSAIVLAAAGFDAVSLANNHAVDAGAKGLRDTFAALEAAGLGAVGAGPGSVEAYTPLRITVGGLEVALLAFDLTGQSPAAGDEPGVASWVDDVVVDAVTAARRDSDIVAVSVHGGIEYLEGDDPIQAVAAARLAALGVDVMWGHGPHVVQPLEVLPGEGGRWAVAAQSLGNFLFDQRQEATGHGAVLEVLANEDGVIAYRLGATDHSDLRVRFDGWASPEGDAVLYGDGWWSLVRPVDPVPAVDGGGTTTGFPFGDVTHAARGNVLGDGSIRVVVAYRYPYAPNLINTLAPDQLIDSEGRTAHLGVFDPADWSKVWAAGTLKRPVGRVAVCDGSIAVAYTELDDPRTVATSAAQWRGFGFDTAPELEGGGTPGCADVDGDGRTEPVVVGRRQGVESFDTYGGDPAR